MTRALALAAESMRLSAIPVSTHYRLEGQPKVRCSSSLGLRSTEALLRGRIFTYLAWSLGFALPLVIATTQVELNLGSALVGALAGISLMWLAGAYQQGRALAAARRLARDAPDRFAQDIAVGEDGLTLTRGESRREIAWRDVARLHPFEHGLVLELRDAEILVTLPDEGVPKEVRDFVRSQVAR